jgi:hypothetical protein
MRPGRRPRDATRPGLGREEMRTPLVNRSSKSWHPTRRITSEAPGDSMNADVLASELVGQGADGAFESGVDQAQRR